MRNLIIDTIVNNYINGLDELSINLINWARKDHGKQEILFEEGEAVEKLKIILPMVSDDELLIMLDAQACLKYR